MLILMSISLTVFCQESELKEVFTHFGVSNWIAGIILTVLGFIIQKKVKNKWVSISVYAKKIALGLYWAAYGLWVGVKWIDKNYNGGSTKDGGTQPPTPPKPPRP